MLCSDCRSRSGEADQKLGCVELGIVVRSALAEMIESEWQAKDRMASLRAAAAGFTKPRIKSGCWEPTAIIHGCCLDALSAGGRRYFNGWVQAQVLCEG